MLKNVKPRGIIDKICNLYRDFFLLINKAEQPIAKTNMEIIEKVRMFSSYPNRQHGGHIKEIPLKKILTFLISVKIGHIIAEMVAIGAINIFITEVSGTNAEIKKDIPKSRSEYINI